MAPRQSISKALPKKVSRSFPSKAVKDVLDGLIRSKIESATHNPKTLARWAEKMKFSILKKISLASKVAFSPRASSAAILKSEIEALHFKIALRTVVIMDNATNHIKKSDLSDIEETNRGVACPNGRFDAQAEKIKDNFGEVAQQLSSNLADFTGCVQALKSSIDAIDSDWKHVSVQLTAKASVKTRLQTARKPNSLQNSNKMPVEVLYSHLEKS